jgi:hypothetical protein
VAYDKQIMPINIVHIPSNLEANNVTVVAYVQNLFKFNLFHSRPPGHPFRRP